MNDNDIFNKYLTEKKDKLEINYSKFSKDIEDNIFEEINKTFKEFPVSKEIYLQIESEKTFIKLKNIDFNIKKINIKNIFLPLLIVLVIFYFIGNKTNKNDFNINNSFIQTFNEDEIDYKNYFEEELLQFIDIDFIQILNEDEIDYKNSLEKEIIESNDNLNIENRK
jgi:hypothetical protein